jgi:hypothetical protein
MNCDEFIRNVEGYYGRYELPLRRALVQTYIKDYNEEELSKIFDRLTLTYSGQFRFAPDIAIIDKAVQDINEELKNKVGGDRLMIGYRPQPKALPEAPISDEERSAGVSILSDFLDKLRKGKWQTTRTS